MDVKVAALIHNLHAKWYANRITMRLVAHYIALLAYLTSYLGLQVNSRGVNTSLQAPSPSCPLQLHQSPPTCSVKVRWRPSPPHGGIGGMRMGSRTRAVLSLCLDSLIKWAFAQVS